MSTDIRSIIIPKKANLQGDAIDWCSLELLKSHGEILRLTTTITLSSSTISTS